MAFGVLCENCGKQETDHDIDNDCDKWKPERQLTKEERDELINAKVTPTH